MLIQVYCRRLIKDETQCKGVLSFPTSTEHYNYLSIKSPRKQGLAVHKCMLSIELNVTVWCELSVELLCLRKLGELCYYLERVTTACN